MLCKGLGSLHSYFDVFVTIQQIVISFLEMHGICVFVKELKRLTCQYKLCYGLMSGFHKDTTEAAQ